MKTLLSTKVVLALALAGQFVATPTAAAPAAPAAPDSYANETKEQHAARTAWFREAKFGMFIHWGIYTVPAGMYQGRKMEEFKGAGYFNPLGEWIMFSTKIPVTEYAGYAKRFNPVAFDATAWVRLAKQAGMKYIVITTKHHDGFAMYPSAVSPFNIAEATSFKRDPLKELAEACRKEGIRLGFYYSQAQDWHHAGGAAYGGSGYMNGGDPSLGHWDPAQKGSFDEYIDRIAVPQVREILTKYGEVAVLWWDTPVGMTPERAARFAPLLKLQPKIITNNRLLDPRKPNPYSGDTSTPENKIPATGEAGRLFEVCMTMNDTWGYKSYDHNWKPAADIIHKLVDIASKGGNFLLNVGPDAQGRIPEPSVERLQAVGKWLEVNHEAIYGTTPSQFRRLPWGRSTTKGDTVYLHVFDWPADGNLLVPGLKTAPTKVTLLASGQALEIRAQEAGLSLTLPKTAPDPVASVIKLEFGSKPQITNQLPTPDAAGTIELPANLAAVVNDYEDNARLLGSGATAYIGEWTRADTVLNWEFQLPQTGTFTLEADVALAEPASVSFTVGKTTVKTKLVATGSMDTFQTIALGKLSFDQPGEHTLDLKSLGPDWKEVRLRAVRLRKASDN